MSRKFSFQKKEEKMQARRIGLTKENARDFLLFLRDFPQEKSERKFILGKNHHIYTGTGSVARARPIAVEWHDFSEENPTEHADTSLQLGARFELREEKKSLEKMDAPAHFIDPKFFTLNFRENFTNRTAHDIENEHTMLLTNEFLVHIQRHIRIQILLIVIFAKV